MTAGRMKMMTPLILIILGVSGVECEVKVPNLVTPGLNFMECTGVYLTIYIFVRHWRSTMPTLILLILGVSGVYCDSHSMRYYITGVSSPGSGLPEYSVVGYVDDREITNYNSDTRQYFPKTEWIKKLGSDYWEEETQKDRYAEPFYKQNVQTAMKRFNQTTGTHTLQRMYGCELRDDGTTEGYQQYGYDGREFMYLDTQRWMWIPTMNEAQITTQRWNSPDINLLEEDQNYLENVCIAFLKKLIEHGREDLEKRVRPEVKVWSHHQSDGLTRLYCLVYGFHPRPVDVKWMRNGTDHILSDEMTPPLPHPDGTYQIRVSVEVPNKEEDTYFCHVEHSSLGDETLRVIWDPPSNDPLVVIVGVAIGVGVVLAIIAICCGFLIKKKSLGYKTTSTSDCSSDNFKKVKA